MTAIITLALQEAEAARDRGDVEWAKFCVAYAAMVLAFAEQGL